MWKKKAEKGKGREGENTSAASFSFVVSDQAICKHEGAVLRSWQKGRKDENDNTEIETNEKGERGCGMSNSCLCTARRNRKK